MPGSAMFAFGHLPDQQIDLLIGEVRKRIRDGLAEKLKRAAAEAGEEMDAAELAQKLDTLTKPGAAVATPEKLPEANAESVARGAVLYRDVKTGCSACHGEKGKGDGAQEQKNTDGTPTRPRDFTRGVFKSGRDPRQLYARLARGMPGSPMPASTALTPQQMGDLVNFILSLSPADATAKVEHRRRQLTAKKVDRLPDDWKGVTEVPIVVAPLWWRDDADADLRVAALHDGKTLAIRLTWRDSAASRASMRPEDFEDMAAVQLFQGDREPFVGMGLADAAIDLWLWRAGRQADAGGLDDYPFDSPDYKRLTRGKEGTDFLTARAAGNPHAAQPNGVSASHLAARGFGSTTFRPRTSQLVEASASWKDGRWTVVLRRPLAVAKGQGVALGSQQRCSVAFAVWYGEAKDRNGQKLVSVWHDLAIE
jgi:mono/diheme cytochrome c family protein